jgi:3-methyladenine DNA glycosylase/8-oxoguanine DNA glycosylase
MGRKPTYVVGNQPVGPLEVEVRPPQPYRLPRGSDDRTLRVRGGIASRLLHVEDRPVLVRAWQLVGGRVALRAEPVDPHDVALPPSAGEREVAPAGEAELEVAIERMRFVLGVDYDLGEFHRSFRRDPLLGPLIRRMPAFRPRRRVWPWEALAAAVVGQLIEAERAVRIERRIVGRWGARLGSTRDALRDVPGAATIAGRAPAELASMDLAPSRAAALRRVAKVVAGGRCRLETPAGDRRLLAMPQIGPWTVQCLALFGRGEMDSLPAGDLGYIKLVGRLAGLGRRATVAEVEEFFAPYEPFRGQAGALALAGLYRRVAQGPPLRLAA